MRHLLRYLWAWVQYIIQELRYLPSDIRQWYATRKQDRLFDAELKKIKKKYGI